MKLLALAALVCALAYGQSVTGEIRLQVKDATSAPLRASGSIEGLATGIHRVFDTNDQGEYSITGLPFGVYKVEVTRQGFAPQTQRVDVHTELPVARQFTLTIESLQTTVEVTDSETLINPEAVSSSQHLGVDQLKDRPASAPGRSVIDLVNAQPGWLLEANGVLHPRGSEYAVQYVVDGIPMYDNRSPAFAQGLGIDEFESMTVRTGGYPAEFGRSLGGVVEVQTNHDMVQGLHGQFSLQGGSFDQRGGFGSLEYAHGRTSFGISGEGFMTDRYLDPPVLENYTNHGSGGSFSVRLDRNWSTSDTTHVYASSHHTGFEVPNELLQQVAGQRQDRNAGETSGQISHTHLFSPNVLLSLRGMIRDTSAMLWGNDLSTPILPSQDRGFREGYFGASISVEHGPHEFKAGADAIFDSIHENFGYRILQYNLYGVPVFDPSVPPTFSSSDHASGKQASGFVQDRWRKGNFTLTAGIRFDHYQIVADQNAWSPRIGAAYALPKLGIVFHASYDRIFQTPAIENLLLASSNLVNALGGEGTFIALRPGLGNYFETGFSKSLFGKLRMDANWYSRRMQNFGDDSLLLNTGVSFPIAYAKADIYGIETKLEVPRWGRFSGYLSYSNMLGRGYQPVAGGLFLGSDAAALTQPGISFPISQDQRNTFRGRVRVEAHRRLWFALNASYNSGLPFEIEGPPDLNFTAAQYGAAIISKVNFDLGRIRPSATFDGSVGFTLMEVERKSLRLQGDVFNMFDRLNVINFAGVLSGTAVDPGRNFAIRLNATF